MAKEEIKAKQVGKNLILIIDGKKYTKIVDEKESKSLQNKVLLFNKRNTKILKDEILSIVDKTARKKEELKTTEKGLKKAVKKEEKGVKKVIAKKKTAKKVVSKPILEKLKKTASKHGYKVVKKSVKIDVSDLLVEAKDGGIAMKGFEQVSMPDLLVKKINEWLDAQQHIQPLLNFWSLCLLNPNPIARTKLFDYLSRQKLIITPSGYFVTYRMVKKTDKKGVFTDNHTHTMEYKVGKATSIPREECDEDGSRDCSKGLHTGTPKFIGIISKDEMSDKEDAGTVGDGYGVKYVTTKSKHNDSYGTGYDSPKEEEQKNVDNTFGNQAIITLINPAHVVSIPNSDTRKMRSCEIYVCKLTTAEEVMELNDKDYLIFDDAYQKVEFDQLQELLKTKAVKAFVEFDGNSKTKKYDQLALNLVDVQEEIRLSSDNINKHLEPEQLKSIIQQRQILLGNNGRKRK